MSSWKKSSYSSDKGQECVELFQSETTTSLRDSKNTTGPVISFPHREWIQLAEALRKAP
ncbi:DUF397 domain-containing protein [Nocardiopsis potens]|uniref:DUF397 domain-containing protein n=1 Tax=Nocardiopsis potens TaxID=1246458 RepID=UPI0003792CDE|nr:DUF397 domain-containing protein [Nocardiopsis potens]